MAKHSTVFSRLNSLMSNTLDGNFTAKKVANYSLDPSNDILYSYDNKDARDAKLAALRQQKLLSYQWIKSGYDTSVEQLNGITQVGIMYRDADLMDAGFPEIGAALDIISEEATCIDKKGKILNIYSKSERIKNTLEDLFINRLDIHVMLPLIVRSVCKYGNEFFMLNVTNDNGIVGWRELPVHEIRRVENGVEGFYGSQNFKPNDVSFVWDGHNNQEPFRSWQVAHFRLIKDSLFLPYGVSILNKVRRAWRMLSMMEDAMLLYRLDKSVERRIYKVNVGAIDDADVVPFLQEFMNNVKRAPVIDPKTGQIDLRKNFLDVQADYVIPVRNGQDSATIEPLSSAQNPTSMEDIEYMLNKILAGLRTPKSFLNFQEAQGKGQNLALLDVRFSRMVNSIQQAVIMELYKIAIIHLYLLGFTDDLTNFTLTMNNPSNQMEATEIDNATKRINAATTALQEQGCGIPLMSWHDVQKEIMGKTDEEILSTLNEIRLEAAMSTELQGTSNVIKKTGMFDKVDNLFGDPDAPAVQPAQNDEEGGGGPMGGGGGGAPMTMDDFGAPDEMEDTAGEEGSEELENLQESAYKQYVGLIKESAKRNDILTNNDRIVDNLNEIGEQLGKIL